VPAEAFQIRTFMITEQNYAGNNQKSSKIMKMKMITALDKVKPNTENMRLNLVAVMCTTVQA
jgi:hypothetical protein